MEKEVRLQDIFPVQEAVFDDDSMTAKVVIIREGMNMSRPRKNYTKAALKQAVKDGVFNNLRMFADHSEKPPIKRSIKELVSGTGITEYEEESDGKGKIVAPVKYFNRDFYEFSKHAHEHMGTSISTRVRGVRFRATDGVVQEDIHGFLTEPKHKSSVDWVVFPSAGGQIESFITAQEGVTVEDLEWGDITPEMVKEHAPELYQTIMESAPKPEVKIETPAKETIAEAPPTNALVMTPEEFEAKIKEAVKDALDSEAARRAKQDQVASSVATLVDGAALPLKTKGRIKSLFSNSEEFNESLVKEAISDAQAELKEAGGPRITGMGVTRSDGKDDKEDFVGPAREAVESAFGIKRGAASSNTGDKE